MTPARIDTVLLRLATCLLFALPTFVFFGKAITDISASLIAALFLLHSIIGKDFSWLKNGWVKIALGLWAYLLIRSLFTEQPLVALSVAAPFIRFIMFAAAIAFWLGRQEHFARNMLRAMGIGVSLLAADIWLQFFTGKDILGKPIWDGGRLTGPYRRPRVGYTTTWMLFPLMAVLLIPRKPTSQHLLHAAFAGFLFLTILITGERTPLLLLLMGIGIVCALHKQLRKLAFIAVPAKILILVIFLSLNPALYERQVVSTRDTISNLWETPYGHIWLDARDTIVKNPVFGIGPHNYRVACKKPELEYRECQMHPHNFYLEMTSETGVVGLIALLAMFGSWVFSIWKNRRTIITDSLLLGLSAGILIRLWPIIANPSFYESWNVIPQWLLVGWLYSILPRNDQLTNDTSTLHKSA